MKKLFFIVAICSYSSFTKAQSTLQFSQAKIATMNLAYNSYVNIGTVPAGKVWKIENVVGGVVNYYSFRINSTYVIPVPVPAETGDAMNGEAIWLPAGTVLDIYSNYNNTPYPAVLVDILEFNVQ